ncbi:MAG: type VI secretion system ATPase TssH, partial [Fimbriimonas ginsengisoli]|nr:type VI secretion system ATPase TssH [Fimbriimonas ginsengisoli]
MRFDKLTLKAQDAFQEAQTLAERAKSSAVDVEHLLLALLRQEGGIVPPLLEKMGVDADRLAPEIEAEIARQPKAEGATSYGAQLSGRLQKVMTDAFAEADKLGDEYVSSEHALLGIVKEPGFSGKTLRSQGATRDALLKAIESLRGGRKVTDPGAEDRYQALEKYGIDITDRARTGKLDHVIGRDDEIRRVIQVLSRRTKNNPV